ncbi:MAG: dihydroorotate dehydrogenase electron transfer subunit [Solirubrobacteraceae bacterium]
MLSKRVVGAYVVLGIGEEHAAGAPGQFYMLSSVLGWGGGVDGRPYLARAISVLYARVGEVGFLLEDVGPGTRVLCSLEPGDEVHVVGPLGRGFSPPEEEREAVLVGGGVGIPPLAMFQERWGGRALLGFRDARHAQAAALLRDAQLATDDGSVGHRGFVTELLERELERRADEISVYACGPPAMLEAVRALAVARGVPAQLALEAPMACGFGACFGCVVATADGYKRVCVDGPVFEAALLA